MLAGSLFVMIGLAFQLCFLRCRHRYVVPTLVLACLLTPLAAPVLQHVPLLLLPLVGGVRHTKKSEGVGASLFSV